MANSPMEDFYQVTNSLFVSNLIIWLLKEDALLNLKQPFFSSYFEDKVCCYMFNNQFEAFQEMLQHVA
jgi:hypothetical protein